MGVEGLRVQAVRNDGVPPQLTLCDLHVGQVLTLSAAAVDIALTDLS
jgi:hypothetical protein